MKPKRRNKTIKLGLLVIILLINLFMFSKETYKIESIDNVKKSTFLAEPITNVNSDDIIQIYDTVPIIDNSGKLKTSDFLLGRYRFNVTGNGIATFHYYKNVCYKSTLSHTAEAASYEYNHNSNFNGNSSGAYLESDNNNPNDIYKAYLVIETTGSKSSTTCLDKYPITFLYGGTDGTVVSGINTKVEVTTRISSAIFRESGYIDVTNFVKKNGYGWYYCCNIPININVSAPDHYACWKLIIIEENSKFPVRCLKLDLGNEMSYNTSNELILSYDNIKTKSDGNVTGQFLFSICGADMYPVTLSASNALYYSSNGNNNNYKNIITSARTKNNPLVCRMLKNGNPLNSKGEYNRAVYTNGSVISYSKSNSTYWRLDGGDLELLEITGNDKNHNIVFANSQNKISFKFQTTHNCAVTTSALGATVDIEVPIFNSSQTTTVNSKDKVTITGKSENITKQNNTGIINGTFEVNIDTALKINSYNAYVYKNGKEQKVSGKIIDTNKIVFENIDMIDNSNYFVYTVDCSPNGNNVSEYNNSDSYSGNFYNTKDLDVFIEDVSVSSSNASVKHTLSINPNGGSYKGNKNITKIDGVLGMQVELNIPIKEGYKFSGWEKVTPNYNNITRIYTFGIEDEILIAKWEKEYTITIDNDREGHIYNSYQVFQGDYSEKVDSEGNKTPILSNIEWGEELQKEVEEGKTHGDKIIELLKEKNSDLYKACETADDVAKILQGKPDDGDIIREFTNIVGKYILDNNIEITKGTGELVEDKDLEGNVIDTNYKIRYLFPGYYIVIDAKANEKDDAYSRYLIDVIQDVTMEPKSSIPTLKKKIIGNNIQNQVKGTGTSEGNPAQYVTDYKRNTATYKSSSEIYNAEDYDIEFELKSYIPNPDGYSTYKFEIVDILAKGFDLDSKSIKVMLGNTEYPKTRVNDNGETVNNYTVRDVVISESNYENYKNYFEEEGKEYLEGYAESQYGKTLILIEINDLIEQLKDGIIEKAQDVTAIYNAKLNGKCEVGNTPNTNETYLKYSNNPYNNTQITQTTTQITYTYTIDLDLNKIAKLKSEDSEKEYLNGAEFEIYNEPNTIEDREPIATITTDELGQALYSSLGAGTYYLKEIKAPEGYNKLREEIEIKISAICDEFGTITWTVEEKNNNNLIHAQIVVKEGTTIPEIKLQVENTTGFQVPVTGGSGTIIFILLGISIMLISVIMKLLSIDKIM